MDDELHPAEAQKREARSTNRMMALSRMLDNRYGGLIVYARYQLADARARRFEASVAHGSVQRADAGDDTCFAHRNPSRQLELFEGSIWRVAGKSQAV